MELVFAEANPPIIPFGKLTGSDTPIPLRVAVAPDGRIVALANSYGTESIVLVRMFP